MHILKSVGVMSVAKVMGILYGCMGLIFVPFFLIFAFVGTFAGAEDAPFAPFAPFAGCLGSSWP